MIKIKGKIAGFNRQGIGGQQEITIALEKDLDQVELNSDVIIELQK